VDFFKANLHSGTLQLFFLTHYNCAFLLFTFCFLAIWWCDTDNYSYLHPEALIFMDSIDFRSLYRVLSFKNLGNLINQWFRQKVTGSQDGRPLLVECGRMGNIKFFLKDFKNYGRYRIYDGVIMRMWRSN